MSTAALVSETWELTGDDARRTLRRCGRRRLLADAFKRLRVADGFSHARSLAYASSLVLVQATIAIVGFASAFGRSEMSSVIVRTFQGLVPGPGGSLLTGAVDQAHRNGVAGRYTALVLGLVATLVTGSTVMGQVERALNRIYGVEQDRPTLQKYTRALLLAVSAGVLVSMAFALLALGRSIGDAIHNEAVANAWTAARWPLALLLAGATMTVLFKYSPRRHQPALSWLAFGAAVSTLLWALATVALAVFFSVSTSFGKTYGPLAGMIALLLWTFLAAVAVLYGAAVAAQLEAVRAGEHEPQDEDKVEESEPDATPAREQGDGAASTREHAASTAS